MADHGTTETDGERQIAGDDVPRDDTPSTDGRSNDATDEEGVEVPEDVVAEAERLTRLARQAVDDDERAAYLAHREQLLADHEFVARVREEDDTLVLHPEEWVEDGTVYPSRIDDTDRAIEISLSGAGDPDDWEPIEQHNADIVATVRAEHGDVHAENARAFADFMGNHYARRVETATAAEIREFLTEYFPRNAWPSAQQKRVVEDSIEHVFEAAGSAVPEV